MCPSTESPAPGRGYLLHPVAPEVHEGSGTLRAGPEPDPPNLTDHEAWRVQDYQDIIAY